MEAEQNTAEQPLDTETEQGEEQGEAQAESEQSEVAPSLPGEGEPTAPAGPITVGVEMMLFEAGMIANALSSKALAAKLAENLYEAEQQAEAAGQPSFHFEFTPFEAGMALNGMSRTAGDILDDLMNRLHGALVQKMRDLGIGDLPGGGGGTLGGGTLSSPDQDQPAGDGEGAL